MEYVVEPTIRKTSQVMMLTFYTILRRSPKTIPMALVMCVRYSELEIEIGIRVARQDTSPCTLIKPSFLPGALCP
jgi:hypothetical protein